MMLTSPSFALAIILLPYFSDSTKTLFQYSIRIALNPLNNKYAESTRNERKRFIIKTFVVPEQSMLKVKLKTENASVIYSNKMVN